MSRDDERNSAACSAPRSATGSSLRMEGSWGELITSSTGSTPTTPQPYVFLVTDGAQDNQVKGLGASGGWSGSNHATTIDKQNTLATVPSCETLKGRGVIVSVLYIPYQPVSPVVTTFAGDEDTAANTNIQYIPASLQKCASPGFFYTANSPTEIASSLNAMFNHALQTAHITN